MLEDNKKSFYSTEPIKMKYLSSYETPFVWNGDYIKERMDKESGDFSITEGWIKPFQCAKILNKLNASEYPTGIKDHISIIAFLYVYKYDEQGKAVYRYATFNEPVKIYRCMPPKASSTFEIKISNQNISNGLKNKDCSNVVINQCGDVLYHNDFNDIIEGYVDFYKCEIEYKTRRCKNKDKNSSTSIFENEKIYSSIVGIQIAGLLEHQLDGMPEVQIQEPKEKLTTYGLFKQFEDSIKNEKLPEAQIWSSWEGSTDTEGLDLQIDRLKKKIESLEPGALQEQCELRLHHLQLLKLGWKKEWYEKDDSISVSETGEKTEECECDDCACDENVRNEKFNQVLPSWTYNLYFSDNKGIPKNVVNKLEEFRKRVCELGDIDIITTIGKRIESLKYMIREDRMSKGTIERDIEHLDGCIDWFEKNISHNKNILRGLNRDLEERKKAEAELKVELDEYRLNNPDEIDSNDKVIFDEDIDNYKKYTYWVPDTLWHFYAYNSNEIKFLNVILNEISLKLLGKIGGLDRINDDKHVRKLFLALSENNWIKDKFKIFFPFYKMKFGDRASIFKHFLYFIKDTAEWRRKISRFCNLSLIPEMNNVEFNKIYKKIVEENFLRINESLEKVEELGKINQFFNFEQISLKKFKHIDELKKSFNELKDFIEMWEHEHLSEKDKNINRKPNIFTKKESNLEEMNMETSRTKMIKTVDELMSIFCEKIEKRFLTEINVDELSAIAKYIVIDSQLLKVEFTSFLMHFLYHPEEQPNTDKDFFEEFMKLLKSEEVKTRISGMVKECAGEKYSELYMNIISEEIDNFMDVYNKVSEKYSGVSDEKENSKD